MTELRRILVLDVDGVLNRWDFDENLFADLFVKVRDGKEPVGVMRQFLVPELVERLHMLVRHTGCQVVLSSNWRTLFRHEVAKFNDTRTQVGFEFEAHDFVPPFLNRSRGESIRSWMDKAGVRMGPGTEFIRVVALDDDRSIETLGEANHVLCNSNYGFTLKKVLEVYQKLDGPDLASFEQHLAALESTCP